MIQSGYKQTEIGVIPEDWELGTLKEAFLRLDAGVSVNSDDSESSDYYILKTSAVRNGRVNIKEAKPVIRSDYARLKCPVKKGSIIISRMNTPAMVGECGFSTKDAPNTFLPDRLWQIEPSSPDYDFQWLNYLLNTEKYSAAIRATATGTSNSMKNIAKERLLEISIPKPPFPEQNRIAEALSDMDELIFSLEKLIEKKKAIKQGAMQELLTGKHRLPGFSGEWEKATIGELVTRKQASLQTGPFGTVLKASEYVDHGISIVSVREIREGRIEIFDETPGVSDLTYHRLPQFVLKAYDIVFARKGSVDRSALIPENAPKLFLGSDGIRLRFSDSALAQFVFQYIQSHEIQQFLSTSAYRTTMVGLNETIISSIPIFVPVNRKEQQSIVEVLSETGKMIASLEKLLDQKKAIKQGMMQQLLTGIIKLV